LIGVEQSKYRDVHDVWFDGIERRYQPLCRASTRVCLLGQERFGPFADV
jgi:hypothetical protein